MTTCRCGCGHALPPPTGKPGGVRKFVNRRHCDSFRRRQRPPRVITPSMRRQWAIEAARTREIGRRMKLCESLLGFDRDEAVWRAFQIGQRFGYRASARERSRQDMAA